MDEDFKISPSIFKGEGRLPIKMSVVDPQKIHLRDIFKNQISGNIVISF